MPGYSLLWVFSEANLAEDCVNVPKYSLNRNFFPRVVFCCFEGFLVDHRVLSHYNFPTVPGVETGWKTHFVIVDQWTE